MKPGNRPKFGKVPIPAAETPEDEASGKAFSDSPCRRVFLLTYLLQEEPKCVISLLPNP